MEIDCDRLDYKTILRIGDDTSAEIVERVRVYFAQFVQVQGEVVDGVLKLGSQPCVSCGEILNPDLAQSLLGEGGFEWGLVHGHGNCRKCGWPCVAHHFVKDADGEDLFSIVNFVLQVHPDNVSRKDG